MLASSKSFISLAAPYPSMQQRDEGESNLGHFSLSNVFNSFHHRNGHIECSK